MTTIVAVYSAPPCPDCRYLKAWLGRTGIVFAERDLTDPAVMDEAKRRFGVRVAQSAERRTCAAGNATTPGRRR